MLSVRFVWVATMTCAVTLVSAQTPSVLFYGDEHVIVNPTSAAGRDYLERLGASRPTPLAPEPVVEKGAALGNFESPAQLGHYACGTRSEAELIVCVDGTGLLTYSDSLAALAFAAKPAEIFVPSDALRQYLANLLAHLPGGASRADLHISTSPCADECAHQIRMERRS